MGTQPCMCGDTQCPSCGRAQGTYGADVDDGMETAEVELTQAAADVCRTPEDYVLFRTAGINAVVNKTVRPRGPRFDEGFDHDD